MNIKINTCYSIIESWISIWIAKKWNDFFEYILFIYLPSNGFKFKSIYNQLDQIYTVNLNKANLACLNFD